jgi:hypothetical protein
MEGLTRLVAESFARHGFDRPLDYRRLHWSRWFACESPHSLLLVPSKPGVFAVAEELASLSGGAEPRKRHPERSEGTPVGGVEPGQRRMLAVLHFGEDDDMAFVLDRMFTRQNPLRDRLASGRCFLRYVIMADAFQRRRTCHSLNQWLVSQGETASGIAAHFAASLELKADSIGRSNGNGRTFLANAEIGDSVPAATVPALDSNRVSVPRPAPDTNLDSGAAKNFHCPQPFPSGF